MIKKVQNLILVTVFSCSLLIAFSGVASAAISEGTKQAACTGIAVSGGECSGADNSGAGVSDLITSAISILSWIVGIAAVIMLIIGGLKYVLSNGDANAISGAKNTILYAIIGLVIAVLAQVIVQFVLKRITS